MYVLCALCMYVHVYMYAYAWMCVSGAHNKKTHLGAGKVLKELSCYYFKSYAHLSSQLSNKMYSKETIASTHVIQLDLFCGLLDG